MKYYELEPEVSGGFGERSIIDSSFHPPIVKRLHILFDGWLGDQLLETFPCFVISNDLASEIRNKMLTGYDFDDVEIEKSDQFKDLYGEKDLPKFYWLKVNGKPGISDFGISDQFTLIVSERALDLIKSRLRNCDIKDWKR